MVFGVFICRCVGIYMLALERKKTEITKKTVTSECIEEHLFWTYYYLSILVCEFASIYIYIFEWINLRLYILVGTNRD